MKLIKKILKISGTLVFVLLVIIAFYACSSVPKLDNQSKQIINQVLKDPIPEIIHGETGFAKSQNHTIWYESIKPKDTIIGAVILIMGNGDDALSWPPKFISNLTDAGYQVIRYDHRGTGLSTSKEKWKKKNAYSLNDMAGDVIAILDTLQIQKAHIVGASMGGMIAQIVAIEYPKRTASLTLIMSSGDAMDPILPPMSDDIISEMVGAVLKHGLFGNRKGQIKRQIIQKRILMGKATGNFDVKAMAEIANYNLKKRDGYKIISAKHHYQAILNAPSRYVELSRIINIPTLVVHGMKDPVIPYLHSEKLVKIIPAAKNLWIKNMGHDLPDSAIQEITDRMILNFDKIIE